MLYYQLSPPSISLVSIILLSLAYLQLYNHVRYVTFNTNLSICSMKRNIHKSLLCFLSYLSLLFIIHGSPNYVSAVDSTFKFSKKFITDHIFYFIPLYIFHSICTECLLFMPFDISNLLLFVYKKCIAVVANHTHCSGK